MTLRFLLLLLAVISALILASLGFGWPWNPRMQYQAGWLGLSLACFFAAQVVDE